MTDDCAIRIPAASTAAVVAGLRDAILRLSGDREELARLSDGAVERAAFYHWDRQWEVMRDIYREALAGAAAVEPHGARRERNRSRPHWPGRRERIADEASRSGCSLRPRKIRGD